MIFFLLVLATAEALDVQAQIVSPPEGSLVALEYVQVVVNVWTPSPSAFKEACGSECSVCLSLDSSEFACWTVFDMEVAPLFASLRPGNHTLEAMVTDATSTLVRESWSGFRRFSVVDVAPTWAVSTPETHSSASPPPQSISMPELRLEEPREMAALSGSFEATYAVVAESPSKFRLLFENAYVCLTLDDAWPCWSLFHLKSPPRFAGLSDGFRTLRAQLAHPDTLRLVPETATDLRGIVVYATRTPDGQVLPPSTTTTTTTTTSWVRSFDEIAQRDLFSRENETTYDTPMGYPAPVRCVATAYADILIDGRARVVPARRGSNLALAAQRFCRSYGVINPNCVGALEAKFKHFKHECY